MSQNPYKLFSQRLAEQAGQLPDTLIYDHINNNLRVQISKILQDLFDSYSYGIYDASDDIMEFVLDEWGQEYLLGKYSDSNTEICEFIKKSTSVIETLDIIEASFIFSKNNLLRDDGIIRINSLIEKMNSRFKKHGFGYSIENSHVIKVENIFIHSEVIKPTLYFLSDPDYSSANAEFLNANEHYRHGRYSESITEAGKSLESVLKIICTKRNWSFNPTDTVNPLLRVCIVTNNLVPEWYEAHFTRLVETIQTAGPRTRNNLGGHGSGTTPHVVPEHIAGFVLNSIASAILLLVQAERALP